MQRPSAPIPIAAGITALGAAIWYSRKQNAEMTSHPEAKRAEGLSGAGIGQNTTTGGHELSSSRNNNSGSNSVGHRKEKTTASLDELPSGGVGGGVGAGGANTRSIARAVEHPPSVTNSSWSSMLTAGGAEGSTGRAPQDAKATSQDGSLPTKRSSSESQSMSHASRDHYNKSNDKSGGGDSSKKSSSSGSSQGFMSKMFSTGGSSAEAVGRAPQDPKAVSQDSSLPTKRMGSSEDHSMSHASRDYYSGGSGDADAKQK